MQEYEVQYNKAKQLSGGDELDIAAAQVHALLSIAALLATMNERAANPLYLTPGDGS